MINLNYEELLTEAHDNNINVIENCNFESTSDGLIHDNIIGLNKNLSTSKKRACVLAEEIGHYYTSSGDIINPNCTTNKKQEDFARLWAYNKLIGLNGIVNAYKAHCKNIYDMAEYLNVDESFLLDALERYRSKYGTHTKLDNYIICFEPQLAIIELI